MVFAALLAMNRNWGWRIYPKVYKQGDALPVRSDLLGRWHIGLRQKTVALPEPASRRAKLEFAALPMLGAVLVPALFDQDGTRGETP